jgi:hypothetical protein
MLPALLLRVFLRLIPLSAFVKLELDDIGKNWAQDSLTYRNAENGRIAFSLTLSKKLLPSSTVTTEA